MVAKLDVPTRYTPMCHWHFFRWAIKRFNEAKPTVSAKPAVKAPTRIQPRRAAKDKFLEAKALNKKRALEDDDTDTESETPNAKKRRLLAETRRRPAPTKRHKAMDDCYLSLQLAELVKNAEANIREAGDKDCPYGPKPWICGACEKLSKEARRKIGHVGWSYHKGKAPVADMQPVGEEMLVADWNHLRPEELRVQRFRDIEFVVDFCHGFDSKILVIDKGDEEVDVYFHSLAKIE